MPSVGKKRVTANAQNVPTVVVASMFFALVAFLGYLVHLRAVKLGTNHGRDDARSAGHTGDSAWRPKGNPGGHPDVQHSAGSTEAGVATEGAVRGERYQTGSGTF